MEGVELHGIVHVLKIRLLKVSNLDWMFSNFTLVKLDVLVRLKRLKIMYSCYRKILNQLLLT